MAIFHLSVKTVSRSAGRSATAAIAYRSGEKVIDIRTGVAYDYSRRNGVEHTEIFLPKNAPEWARNRSELWNAAELSETRKNSTVAREFEVALPAEFNQVQRLELVQSFAQALVERHEMAVDVAIHSPGKEGDDRNYHAHILCTTRRLQEHGFTEKTRELDDQKSGEIPYWRSMWAELSNQHLERAGFTQRIDHRTLAAQSLEAQEHGKKRKAQMLDRIPTTHLGPNVVHMEKKGIATDRGAQHREIQESNQKILKLVQAPELFSQMRRQAEHLLEQVERQKKGIQPIDVHKKDMVHSLFIHHVKDECHKERAKEFPKREAKAQHLHQRLEQHCAHQEKRLNTHEEKRPLPPEGWLARFKQNSHNKTAIAWYRVQQAFKKRLEQLQKRLKVVEKYFNPKSYDKQQEEKRLEHLTYKKVAHKRPKLIEQYLPIHAQEQAIQQQKLEEEREQQQILWREQQKERELQRSKSQDYGWER